MSVIREADVRELALADCAQKALALLSFLALFWGELDWKGDNQQAYMPIIRLRELNGNQEKSPNTETRDPGRQPKRAHLFARIADLKLSSSTKTLQRSRKLIENSRRAIFEAELSLTKND